MSLDLWWLSFQHLRWRARRSLLLIACLSLPMIIPLLADLLLERYRGELTRRADATPLLVGPRGHRFDVVLNALWFRRADLPALPARELDLALSWRRGPVLAINVRSSARGRPVVATDPEYFRYRRLKARSGRLPLVLGECVLGAGCAAELGLGVGDRLQGDLARGLDPSLTPPLLMEVVGILAPCGGPEDDAVLTDLATGWALQGFAHGHEAAEDTDPAARLGEDDRRIVLGASVVAERELDVTAAEGFHLHGDPGELPISALLLLPTTQRQRDLMAARYRKEGSGQVLVPSEVTEELLAYVVRVKRWIDGLGALLGVCTLALTALVMRLGVALRERELRTITRIGAPPGTVRALVATELLLLLGGAAVVTGATVGLAHALLPSLSSLL